MFKVRYKKRLNIFHSWEISYISNNEYHRLDGPAVTMKSEGFISQFWYKNGLRHNLSGPAILNSTTKRWFVDGEECSELEWKIKKNV